jgi:hypothetical protein
VRGSIRFARPIIFDDLISCATNVMELYGDHILRRWIGNIILTTLRVRCVQQYSGPKTATMSMTARFIAITTTPHNLRNAVMDARQQY